MKPDWKPMFETLNAGERRDGEGGEPAQQEVPDGARDGGR